MPAYSPTARDKVGIYERYAEHYWRRYLSYPSVGEGPTVNKDTKVYYTTKGKDLFVLCTQFPTTDIGVENNDSDFKTHCTQLKGLTKIQNNFIIHGLS